MAPSIERRLVGGVWQTVEVNEGGGPGTTPDLAAVLAQGNDASAAQIKNVADGTDPTDVATVEQLSAGSRSDVSDGGTTNVIVAPDLIEFPDAVVSEPSPGVARVESGGSIPGSIRVAQLTFAQVAGGGHSYTGTFDLPPDSRLLKCDLETGAGWDVDGGHPDGHDLDWVIGDESDSDAIFQGSAGVASDGVYSSVYGGVSPQKWSNGNPLGSVDFGTGWGMASYPSGQTITAVCGPDVIGGTGTAVVRLYYAVAPTTAPAVVTP